MKKVKAKKTGGSSGRSFKEFSASLVIPYSLYMADPDRYSLFFVMEDADYKFWVELRKSNPEEAKKFFEKKAFSVV